MKKRIMNQRETIGLVIAWIVLICALFKYEDRITTANGIEIFITAVLASITYFYAWRTAEQAKASKEMVEETKKARAAPIITMQWGVADPTRKEISVILENEGLGPALNLEWYLTHKIFKFTKKLAVYTTFKVGQKYPLSLPSEEFDFKTWDGLTINCDYQSVYGERFRSTLRCESKEKRILAISPINSREKNQ